MMTDRNCSRGPVNYRNMQNAVSQMSYNEFLGIEKSNTENLDEMPLAMAYVPYQQWRSIYEPREGFRRGTIFKELDLPFTCAKECK